jgi:spore coat polysaccharide biosynthesis predicted glycosyltransferase SpsG
MPAPSRPTVRILFRVAAGPRIGYGHLIRTTVLGQALNLRPVVSLRGSTEARTTARQLGCRLAAGSISALMRSLRPELIVIDDPSAAASTRFCRAARRAGARVASIHDLGLAHCGADLAIDGSVVHPGGRPLGPALLGPRYAIVSAHRPSRTPRSNAVLIALGGGRRRAVAWTLAKAIRRARPAVPVRIAAGLALSGAAPRADGVTWLGPQSGLGLELARAAVAVVGGGVSVYEACRLGTPVVAMAVVAAQQPTVRGFARLGAARDGGSSRQLATAVREVTKLIDGPDLRRRVSLAGRALVDGQGAIRVAEALTRLARGSVATGVRRLL